MTINHRWRVLKRKTFLKVLISAIILLCIVFPVQAATADFYGTPTSGNVPLFVTFTDMSKGENITSWFWNFGDGSGSDLKDPTTIYLYPGNFTVELTVTEDGQSDNETKVDYIRTNSTVNLTAFDVNLSSPLLTVNQFMGTIDPATGEFTAEFTVFAEGVTEGTTFKWNFGDGDQTETDVPSVSHSYTQPGIYEGIWVKVKDSSVGTYKVYLPMNLVVIDGSLPQYQQFTGQYWLGFFEEV